MVLFGWGDDVKMFCEDVEPYAWVLMVMTFVSMWGDFISGLW